MIKLRGIICGICTAMLLVSDVYAAGINVSFDKTKREIVLDGELGKQNANSRVVVLIAKGEKSLPQLEETDYLQGKEDNISDVVTFLQLTSDDNGDYTAPVIESDICGAMKVYVSGGSMESSISEEFFIPTEDAVNGFAGDISLSSDDEEILELLDAESTTAYFGSDMRYYKKIDKDTYTKQKIAEAIYAQKLNDEYKGEDKIKKIDDDIYIYSYLGYLSKLKSADEIKKLLDIDNSDYITMDKRRISKLLNLPELYKKSVFSYLNSEKASQLNDVEEIPLEKILELASKKEMYTPEQFEDALSISTINYKFSVANGWQDAYSILIEHIDAFDSLTKKEVDEIEDNQSLLSYIIKKSYFTTDDLSKDIKNYKEDDDYESGRDTVGRGTTSGGIKVNYDTQINNNQNIIPNNSVFVDLGTHEWAKEAIESLNAKGVVNGYGNAIFNPGGNVTREEFVKIIVGAMSIGYSDTQVTFDDVESGSWYSDYVARASAYGIITGIDSANFGVGMNITRQDMAVIVWRALKYKGFNVGAPVSADSFSDVTSISEYALEAVSVLKSLGIVSGMGDNTFSPKNNVTRAEAAMVIYNVINKYGL